MSALNNPLPLRATTVWGGYAQAALIPHRYGRASGSLLQYDASGRIWCWSDHASMGIDAVAIDGKPVSNWTWRNDLDVSNHPVTLIEFDQAQAQGASIVATGRGKANPVAGGLMDGPADVIWDVLANLAGSEIPRARLDAFAQAASQRGLAVGGSIDAADSAQTVARAICASIGAQFSTDARGVCFLWPVSDYLDGAARGAIDAHGTASAQSSVADLINDLVLEFDLLDGQPRQSLRLEAPDSIRRFGRRTETRPLAWTQSARVAFDVGRRLLQHYARPGWHVTGSATALGLRVGDVVTMTHARLPVSGNRQILARERDLDTGAESYQSHAAIGDVPDIHLVSQAQQFAAQQVTVQTSGSASARELTLTETDGTPISNAQVTLDGQITRTTDAAGRVTFPASYMTPGEHDIDIRTADGRTLSQTILVQ